MLKYVPDPFKIQEKCDTAMRMDPWLLNYAPGWFVTQQQVKIWHNDDYYHDDDELVEWYESYKRGKIYKAKIIEELMLMPIAWHPSCWWEWCVPEKEKKERNIVEVTGSCFKII